MQTQKTLDEFKNEPFVDYSKAENADAMRAAIEQVRGELGREYPVIINGEKISVDAKFESINPAEKGADYRAIFGCGCGQRKFDGESD